jgi:recombination protein RecR
MAYPEAMSRLLAELEKLPGVGPRTAERLANHLLEAGSAEALRLAKAIEEAVRSIRPCSTCGHLADRDPCPICADGQRDRRRILVVEQSQDLEAMERAGWRGVYHVLQGSIRAEQGGEARDLALAGLRRRIADEAVEEVILGTDPDFEGDGTALLVAEMLEKAARPGLRVSRLARGVPTGTSIEYANPAVLAEALTERKAFRREDGAP